MATGLATGTYRIENIKDRNLAYLPDSRRGSLLTCRPAASNNAERWIITALGGGRYTIQNVQHRTFACTAGDAGPGEEVLGRFCLQKWHIIEVNNRGEYLILACDKELGWSMANHESGNNVVLGDQLDDTCHRWRIVAVQAGSCSPSHVDGCAPIPISNPASVPGNLISNPALNLNQGDSSLNMMSVVPWQDTPRRLKDGEYAITNRVTDHQLVLWSESQPIWVNAPWFTWPGYNENHERTFRLDINNQNGTVEITSTFYYGGEGPRRWLSDGPNFRPSKNLCRLFGVPGSNSAFFICTDARTQNSPVMVLQDPLTTSIERMLPISVPLDPSEQRQHWMFKYVRP